jgi:hypothetical protein
MLVPPSARSRAHHYFIVGGRLSLFYTQWWQFYRCRFFLGYTMLFLVPSTADPLSTSCLLSKIWSNCVQSVGEPLFPVAAHMEWLGQCQCTVFPFIKRLFMYKVMARCLNVSKMIHTCTLVHLFYLLEGRCVCLADHGATTRRPTDLLSFVSLILQFVQLRLTSLCNF